MKLLKIIQTDKNFKKIYNSSNLHRKINLKRSLMSTKDMPKYIRSRMMVDINCTDVDQYFN